MSAILVASSGGHLRELVRLRPRLGLGAVVWVTFDGPQARSLLRGEETIFAAYTAPRDYRNTARNAALARRVLRERDVEVVVSTGAAVALSFLPLARARRIPAHYVESAARTAGPSLSGRMLASVPGVRLYTQHPGWRSRRWRYGGSVFDGFAASPVGSRAGTPRNVVVTLGTMPFGFERLVRRLREILPAGAEVVWQSGATPVAGVPGASPRMTPDELRRALAKADTVVTHAGVGSILDALEAGKRPVVVPRRKGHGEHVDDHQTQVAEQLAARGLALTRDASALTGADLREAAGWAVASDARPPPFELL